MLGWDSLYAWNQETFGSDGTLGRANTTEAVLTRDLRAALERLNPGLPASAVEEAIRTLSAYDVSRSMVQHNCDFYRLIRSGVPVEYRDAQGHRKSARAKVIHFDNAAGTEWLRAAARGCSYSTKRAKELRPRTPDRALSGR